MIKKIQAKCLVCDYKFIHKYKNYKNQVHVQPKTEDRCKCPKCKSLKIAFKGI